jgi:hypothetical protein
VTLRRRGLLRLAPAAGLAPLLGATGCAAPPGAQHFAGMPVGTVLTFRRISTGSFGNGTAEVVWTYREGRWQGQPVLEARHSAGGTLHDPATFGIIAMLDAGGRPTMSFDPPLAVQWPLTVGKHWTSTHQVAMAGSSARLTYEAQWVIDAFEQADVPAGRFDTFRVVREGSDGEKEIRWIGLEPGLALVRRTLLRGPSYRLGPGTQTAELVALKLPAR